ncbi:hypothetical protein FIBSPDRAFT_1048596 [Athelia psychrophila]|uniref:Uncharacterized protein n=1 Tax=Athelia psychrophila TaxID=1759441 RepID=A0A166DKS2_9AGAM|nr:hypothetical protein FIBSPDRAFT_1048596 [Fibularhizoctonia sp. CBS 109695]
MSLTSSPEPAATTSLYPQSLGVRHVTSQTAMGSPGERKTSGRVNSTGGVSLGGSLTVNSGRLGSKSPNSIPSSPTSVHSSSSAIFERDIEPLASPSPPHLGLHPANPHRTPRSKATEQLDQSVPSVLDSAAAILASTSGNPLDDDRISVVAPTKDIGLYASIGSRSGMVSPIGSYGSRSPSPTAGSRKTSLLLAMPSPSLQTNASLSPTVRAGSLSIQTSPVNEPTGGMGLIPNASTPSIVTPTSAYYSVTSMSTAGFSESGGSSPTTTTMEHPPSSFPMLGTSHTQAIPQAQSRSPGLPPVPFSTSHTSHPPSPMGSPSLSLFTPASLSASPSGGSNRLSFIAYSDLLASTPTTSQPLSSFTTSASSIDPPPHIPSVSGITQAAQHFTPSHSPLRGSSLRAASGVIEGHPSSSGGAEPDVGMDDIGGEWEREGFGGGLEERLEALLGPAPSRDRNMSSGSGLLTPERMAFARA